MELEKLSCEEEKKYSSGAEFVSSGIHLLNSKENLVRVPVDLNITVVNTV